MLLINIKLLSAVIKVQWRDLVDTEHSDSLKGGECLDWLSECELLKEESAPWG
jgi:hypothetical protein